uniref:BZIP domain-containing protein n=2 Tax=Sar TaxID=2698737 RepID=A0A7S3PJY7_9STRA|mmetsp:Transcript_16790/g.20713  ORF Transcript_16790/g.20713 Transcript_16790/m.20713 type:complete len:410 (-) Transcript_16790:899-2128(-)|eukprot:CAMPEP_0204854270 /NCGR_PEP_ID=MMETSP1347-20130617/14930_1 /ASSEMBLY_ACC=CAM_ASM_000690 /TAXON_ID=215587 /ORGANISM="Aplanochytrium stocchinoi, Strain GSBS06" /LENGTH=409 /DNA_ID=CAMNT_0051999767 /DNA_START=134 /DNA_END=1363 /DNA_ORIENTATION=-
MDEEKALNFVAAKPHSGAYNISPVDSDFASWIMMNAEMFPDDRRPRASSLGFVDEPQADEIVDGLFSPDADEDSKKIKEEKQNAKGTKSLTKKKNAGKESAETKRARRLEKNREIARNCRKRKRERYLQLEEEVVKLRQWNKQLEMKLNQEKGGKSGNDIREAEVREMEKLLEVGKPGTEEEKKLSQKLHLYKDMYSDFGRERKQGIQYHMNRLKSLLLPNQVSKMTMWSLQQDDDFYDEKTNQKTFGGGIWNMLCEELELSAEQKRGLIDMRHGIRKQRRNIAECIRILKELGSRVDTNFSHMASQMENVMGLITPAQQAKFLLWVEKNQACMHMLNNIWNTQHEELSTDDEMLSTSSRSISGGSTTPPPAAKTTVSASDMAKALMQNNKGFSLDKKETSSKVESPTK